MGEEGSEYRALILELFTLALEPLCVDEVYDFSRSDIPGYLLDKFGTSMTNIG